MGGQRLAALGAGDLVEVLVDALHGAELDQQLGGGLVSDPRHPEDVVGGVALEADEVGNLLRPDAVALADPLGRVDDHVRDAARGHHDADLVGGELEGVAVGGDHAHRVALGLGDGGQRADHVVGLVALDPQVAVAERLDQRCEVRLLGLQQLGRRLAVGLVVGVELEPAGGPLVPGDQHGLGPVVDQQSHQHVGHAQQRVGRLSVHRLQLLRQGVEAAVGKPVAVHQEHVAGMSRFV